MDVIYTDEGRNDLGVLSGFTLDIDVAGTRDFQIKQPIDHNELVVGGYIYIDGQEYGGRIDKIKVDTDTEELYYTGRNWRGILASKVVCPPEGKSHRVLNGRWYKIIQGLFNEYGLYDLFVADDSDFSVDGWQVDRYVTLLDMMDKLLSEHDRRLDIRWSGADGKVLVGAVPIRDLTDTVQYETDDKVHLIVEDNRGGVNHLICLGQGELTEREVVHLYCTATGSITEYSQHYTGLDEIVATFEDTSAENRETLKKNGFQRLVELKNSKSAEAKVEDYDVQIGDIIGGVERITGIRVAEPVTNIIFKIDANGRTSVEYKCGSE